VTYSVWPLVPARLIVTLPLLLVVPVPLVVPLPSFTVTVAPTAGPQQAVITNVTSQPAGVQHGQPGVFFLFGMV
jgi:hypothetical protein